MAQNARSNCVCIIKISCSDAPRDHTLLLVQIEVKGTSADFENPWLRGVSLIPTDAFNVTRGAVTEKPHPKSATGCRKAKAAIKSRIVIRKLPAYICTS